MVKYLNDQIARIKQFEVYERDTMVHDSEEARNTDNIEVIIEQCRRNEVWLNHIQELKERLNKFHRSTQDTLVLKGLNDGMKERLHHILNESKTTSCGRSFILISLLLSINTRTFSHRMA